MPTKTYRQLSLDDAQRFVMRSTRRFDHETSIAAAERVHAHAENDRATVLAAHYAHPRGLTDFQVEELTGIKQTSCGKRRLELERAGLITYAGINRPAPSGSPARVYVITQAGARAFQEARKG